MLLHTASLTHRPVYAQTLLYTHTHAFAHSLSYTQTRLRTNAFTHSPFTYKHFCTQILRRTNQTRKKLSVFHTRTLFCAKRLPQPLQNHARTSFRAKGLLPDQPKKPKKPSDFDTRTSFRAKTLPWTLQNRNFLPKFLTTEPHFVRKQCRGGVKSQFYLSLTIEPHFVQKGCRGGCKIAILLQFLTIESHFARNSCCGECKIAILLSF